MNRKFGDYVSDMMIIETSNYFIFRCHNIKTNNEYAIKTSKNSKILDQYEILKDISHPNIIEAIDVIQSNEYYCIVFPLASTDLNNQLLMLFDPLSKQTIRKIMKDILTAVEYLHLMGVWHRNINLENILVFKKQEKYVLGGFSTAGRFTKKITERCGTPQYMAPEIIEGREYDNKIDIWSIGVVLYSLYTGLTPYEQQYNADELIDYAGIPPVARDLIKHLLCVDPNERPSAHDALLHPFFKDED